MCAAPDGQAKRVFPAIVGNGVLVRVGDYLGKYFGGEGGDVVAGGWW